MSRAAAMAVLLAATAAFGQAHLGKGEGGIVAHDGAPVYSTKKGTKVKATFPRGTAVAGAAVDQTTVWLGDASNAVAYQFIEKDGRVAVMYFTDTPSTGNSGWMVLSDLERFTYDGSCGEHGSPTTIGVKRVWNLCFKEARDAKLEELRARWAAEQAAKAP